MAEPAPPRRGEVEGRTRPVTKRRVGRMVMHRFRKAASVSSCRFESCALRFVTGLRKTRKASTKHQGLFPLRQMKQDEAAHSKSHNFHDLPHPNNFDCAQYNLFSMYVKIHVFEGTHSVASRNVVLVIEDIGAVARSPNTRNFSFL